MRTADTARPRPHRHGLALATLLALLLAASACSDPASTPATADTGTHDDVGTDDDANDDVANLDAEPDTALDAEPDVEPDVEDPDRDNPLLMGTVRGSFTVRPGVELATVFNAAPGTPLTLYAADGTRLLTLLADSFGQANFAYIPAEHTTLQSGEGLELTLTEGTTLRPANGYVIRNDAADLVEAAPSFRVLAVDDVPDPALYERQELRGVHFGILGLGQGERPEDGFNYIEVRDGVKLSATVRFPDPALWGPGPWPTVIEYSGYSPSRPETPEPGSRIATLLGFASVGVNMRGSGCSGGVFDVFNPAQHADGYDIVEVVARQPWALNHKVGMVGLSYSGISQLYVASTRPPSLAAITPLSVIGDSWGQLWPGGIYNDGFTRQWLENRDDSAASGGQSWTDDRIADGDTVCAEHQNLRGQNIRFETFFKLLQFYPDDAAARSLPLLVPRINVPVYLTGAFQDEQTGAQFTDMLDRFTDVPTRVFTLFNGRHPDGYSPLVLTRWLEFLNFYIGRRVPRIADFVRTLAAPELSREFGVDGLGFEPDRFTAFADDDWAGAVAAYEAEPDVRVLFESGAADGQVPGAPLQRFEATWSTWPPPDATAKTLWLGPDGALTEAAPTAEQVDTYLHDPDAGSDTFFGPRGYQLLTPLWDIDWTNFPADHSLSYLTAPLTEDLVVAGSGHATLWVASEADDAQVQVTLTEVRPDDTEVLVQSGWLRLGHRKVDAARSDDLRIFHTFVEEDFQPLVPGEFVEADVALPSVAHAFRAGTRLRVIISSPGRNHGTWEFTPPDYQGATPRQSVALSPDRPSRLVLPVVTGVPVADGFPACPSLRGQPCRPYAPSVNSGP